MSPRIVADERVPKFVGERVGRVIHPPFTCMGIEKGGKIVAGVVFNCFTRSDVHVTVAGQGWTRWFLEEVGRYAFDQLGCIRISATTEYPAVVRFAERLGGQLEGLKRNHFGYGRDAFIVGILKEEYRFHGRS